MKPRVAFWAVPCTMRFVVPAGVDLGFPLPLPPPQLARTATKSTMTAAVEISRSSAVPENVSRKRLAKMMRIAFGRGRGCGKNAVPNIAHRSATNIASAAKAVKPNDCMTRCAGAAGPFGPPRGERMVGRNPLDVGTLVFGPVV